MMNIYGSTISMKKLGTREIDLSSYIKQSDMVAITNSEIDAAFA